MDLGIFCGPIIFFLFLWFLGAICTSIDDYLNRKVIIEKKVEYSPDPWWWRVLAPEIYEEMEEERTNSYNGEWRYTRRYTSFSDAVMWGDLGHD